MWVQGKSGRERIVGKRLKATQSLNMDLDAVPRVKSHIYLSNF